MIEKSDAWSTELHAAAGAVERALLVHFTENSHRWAYGDVFEPLYHDLAEFVARRGKRIRPLVFLASYRALGGTRPLDDPGLILAATSLEFLHAFILIHDDVIDRSDKRRGLPTFHKLVEERMGKLSGRERVGQNIAIVMGDFLFAIAIDALSRTDFPQESKGPALARFLQYLTDTGAGEAYDILLAARDITRITEEEILRMYQLKTTKYTFEAPVILGGLLAGAPEERLLELEPVIEPLGRAFQIENDLAEFSQVDPQYVGLSTDLIEGKKTLLIRRAYERLSELDRSFLQLCLSSNNLTEGSVLKVRELIRKSGAVRELEIECESLRAQSTEALQRAPFEELQKETLARAFDLVRRQSQRVPLT